MKGAEIAQFGSPYEGADKKEGSCAEVDVGLDRGLLTGVEPGDADSQEDARTDDEGDDVDLPICIERRHARGRATDEGAVPGEEPPYDRGSEGDASRDERAPQDRRHGRYPMRGND